MVKILRKSKENHEAQFPKITLFYWQNIDITSLFYVRHYNAKDGIQIQTYNSNNESLNHSRQFISEKVKKNLRRN